MSKIIRTSKPSVLPWYAAALVFLLAARAQESGRIPFVICQSEQAVRVYERVGFTPWGEEWLCLRDGLAE